MSAPQTPVAECLNGYLHWSFLGGSIDGLKQLQLSAVLFKSLLKKPESLKIKLGHIFRLLQLIKTGFKMPQYSSSVFTGCVGMQRFSSLRGITLKHNLGELRKRLSVESCIS